MRLFILLLYYGFLRFLPATDNAYWIFSLFRKTRSWVGHFLFDQCGKQINIEHGANFGTGRGISIGDRSGIGIRAKIRGPLHIGSDVMMGPDVIILTSTHEISRTDIPMREQGGGTNRFRGRDCRGSCGKPKRARLRYCRRSSGQSYQNEKIINSL